MNTAKFAETLDPSWVKVPAVRLERYATQETQPDRHVLVERDGQRLRYDIFLTDPEAFPFEDVKVWHDLLVIGYGSTLYCVGLKSREINIYELETYFGSIALGPSYCLVASGSEILRIDHDGTKVWQSEQIAMDGVIISDVNGETISGSAEWDPPGGWEPFKISLKTGRTLPE